MSPQGRPRIPLAVLLLLLCLVVGTTIASEMAFKFNKPLTPGFVLGAAPKGDNWLALPWSNPYPTYTRLCAFLGLGANGNLTQINPATGALTNVSCAVGSAASVDPTRGVRLRITGAAPVSRVLVGSHNSGLALPAIVGGFLAGTAPKGDNWISLPYHCAWRKASDVCTALGLGLPSGTTVSKVDAATGTVTNFTCGGLGTNFSLTPAQAIRVRKVAAGGVAPVVPPVY